MCKINNKKVTEQNWGIDRKHSRTCGRTDSRCRSEGCRGGEDFSVWEGLWKLGIVELVENYYTLILI